MNQLKWIADLISCMIGSKFYGSLIIKFESGRIVHVKKETSIKIEG